MVKKGENEAVRAALYRHYRPRSLADVVGQPQVTEVLKRSLEKGKVAHAYLLTGPKGTGKTSVARILAHEINQLPYDDETTHLDIIEIDAASNNGVDDVRDLRDKVMLAPTSASKKVYIVDEVHMLSKAAFNALLKTLEEPPAHIVFILATTDLHKVPATIISRTQHFSFHSISRTDIAAQLRKIADAEKIKVSPEALEAIAARGDGSFRNSISILDQMSSFADDKEGVTLDLVESTLGLAPHEAVRGVLRAVVERDVAELIAKLDELEAQGIQPTILADQLIQTVRAQLGAQPHLVNLLDALLNVSASPQPQLKLLTVLVGAIKPSADQRKAAVQAAKPSAVLEKPVPKKKVAAAPIEPESEAEAEAAPAPEKKVQKPKSDESVEIDWAKMLEHAKEHMVALYSVLVKCSYQLDGHTLTIYAGRKFNKTKLDELKYLTQLREALSAAGAPEIDIVTLPYVKPPSDEKLARVAEMMGGGQEVQLGDEV
jgi:DNA polymerase-3 subunit gamma/tau